MAHKRSLSAQDRYRIVSPRLSPSLSQSPQFGTFTWPRSRTHSTSIPVWRKLLSLLRIRGFARKYRSYIGLFVLTVLLYLILSPFLLSPLVTPNYQEIPKVERNVTERLKQLEDYYKELYKDEQTNESEVDLEEDEALRYAPVNPPVVKREQVPLPIPGDAVTHAQWSNYPDTRINLIDISLADIPPAVYKLPDQKTKVVPIPIQLVDAPTLDLQTCPERGGLPCQFLFPAWLGEQETKAQSHLHQLGLLALSLNRTLVLPNVIRSRLGSCYHRPFTFYYSINSLSALGVRTITQQEFYYYTQQRDPSPSGQMVSVTGAKLSYPDGAIEIDTTSDPSLVPTKPDRKMCMNTPKAFINFNNFSPLTVYPPNGWHKTDRSRKNFGESLVNTLRSSEIDFRAVRNKVQEVGVNQQRPEGANALIFNYELRFPILTPKTLESIPNLPDDAYNVREFKYFPYAPIWTKLSNHIGESLNPFIGIHWRMETLPVEAIEPCTHVLIEKLKSLARQYPQIKTVYMATDYPIEGLDNEENLIPHSGTFGRLLAAEHHRSMRYLVDEFALGRVAELRLTTFLREQYGGGLDLSRSLIEELATVVGKEELILKLNNGEDIDTEEITNFGIIDPGLLGIIDKGILINAEIFLAGFPGSTQNDPLACGKESSFTRQITKARERIHNEELEQRKRDGEEEIILTKGKIWSTLGQWQLDTAPEAKTLKRRPFG